MTLDVPASERLSQPLNVPSKLLMGAGPSNAPERVLEAGALPLLGHLHTEFVQIMDEVKLGLQYAFQTTNELTLAISGTGHAGMEAALVNLLEPGDVILIGLHGIWGERAVDMATRQGADVRTVQKPPGENFTVFEINEALERHRPVVLFLIHGESSTGVVQPLESFGALCKKYNCLFLVDTVASLGGEPFFMDRWGIDVVYTGSQKVLGAPPGTAPISFSPRAQAKIASRKRPISSFYFDMNWLSNYWGCDGAAVRKYHHTAPISSIYALREALAVLAQEGLEKSWERHRRVQQLLHDGLHSLGLNLFVSDPSARLTCITSVKVPDGIDWKAVSLYAMQKHRVEIAGGLGPTVNLIWRIGLMGQNATEDKVKRVLEILRDALDETRGKQVSSL